MNKIVLKEKTYELVKEYVDLIQTKDKLIKSFEDRILELLFTQINLSEFRYRLRFIKRYANDLEYTQNHVYFRLRDITLDYLSIYCFKDNYWSFNKGLYHLVEQAILKITAEHLKSELDEIVKNTHNLQII